MSNGLARQPNIVTGGATVVLTLMVGSLDYITGPHVSMSAFYLLPLVLAAWSVGPVFALIVALASTMLWMTGNVLNGDVDFLSPALAAWNGGVQLVSYVVVAFTVARLRDEQRRLETRVRERTAAAEKLQLELLHVSEREQRRIGQDLHDGLCQHLAGAAFTCQALEEELAEHGLPQAQGAQNVVDLIKEGVLLARQSAMGLDPVEMSAEGLMESLDELASTTRSLFKVECRFECDSPVLIRDSAIAGQLFRIAQEAVRNALNHGKAVRVSITLAPSDEGLELRIEDDGVGISHAVRSDKGMGLSIMRSRAGIIGASLDVRDRNGGGTVVRCVMPDAALTGNAGRE